MKNLLTLIAIAGLTSQGLAQTSPASPETSGRFVTSFELTVHAPYSETAALFGPEGERAWAGEDWDPKFVYPQPANDVEGAVFTVRHGTHNIVWVNTLFDVEARHFQYVYFLADLMVTTIDVRFKPIDSGVTRVNVVYTRTALTPEANAHIAAMAERDKKAGSEWQQAIDNYLASMKSGKRP